jgi:hypothetical protein
MGGWGKADLADIVRHLSQAPGVGEGIEGRGNDGEPCDERNAHRVGVVPIAYHPDEDAEVLRSGACNRCCSGGVGCQAAVGWWACRLRMWIKDVDLWQTWFC